VLELGARHPDVAGALIVGGAYPDWAGSGLREVWREFLGAHASNTPDLARIDASLGEGADHVKSLHPGGEARWQKLVDQTASMWLDYEGLTDDDLSRIHVPTLVFAGDRDAQITVDLTVSLYEVLTNAELAVCPMPITPRRLARVPARSPRRSATSRFVTQGGRAPARCRGSRRCG
jgi:pimeloyl-ACP methyl ester carboxylesterase